MPFEVAESEIENLDANVSCRDGVYRLRLHLVAVNACHEIVLHGVTCLQDALHVARMLHGSGIAQPATCPEPAFA